MTITHPIPMRITQATHRRIPPPWVRNWISDPQWRIYHNDSSGAAVETKHDGRIDLIPNRIVVIPAWLEFRGHCSEAFEHTWISAITPTWSTAACRRMFQHLMVIETGHLLYPVLRDLCANITTDPSHSLVRSCWLSAAMHMVIGHMLDGVDTHQIPTSPHLTEILSYIEQHLGDDLRIAVLATAHGWSEAHLSRVASQELGQSLSSYIREQRAAAAAIRLAHSEDSIDHIASTLGFADRYHFSRVFAHIMGHSPAAYRRQVTAPLLPTPD